MAERREEKVLLQHILLLKFKEEITATRIEEIINQFASLQKVIKQIKAFNWGKDISRAGLQQGYTHVVEMLFDNEDDVDTYLYHPVHVDFNENILLPTLVSELAVDYYPIDLTKP